MRLETVLLDMGGVLLDVGSSNGLPGGQPDYRGRQALLRRLDGPATLDDLEAIVFGPWRREYRRRYELGREADLAPFLDELRRGTGSTVADMDLLATWFGPFGESLRPVAGAVEAVEVLRRLGLRVALISNVPLPGALYREILDRHGFADLIDTYRFSYDSGHRKPSPFMLRSALGELGAGAMGAVMVGDRKESDVAAGRAAGTGTVWIRSDHSHGPEPDWTIPSIAHLPELLDRLSG